MKAQRMKSWPRWPAVQTVCRRAALREAKPGVPHARSDHRRQDDRDVSKHHGQNEVDRDRGGAPRGQEVESLSFIGGSAHHGIAEVMLDRHGFASHG
jgi:hypothetical protein